MRFQLIASTLVLISTISSSIAFPVHNVALQRRQDDPEEMVKEFIEYSQQAAATNPNDEKAVKALADRYNSYSQELKDVIDNVNDGVHDVQKAFQEEEARYADLDDEEKKEAVYDLTTMLTHSQETFFVTYLMQVFDPAEITKYSTGTGSLHPDVQDRFDSLQLGDQFNLIRYALALEEVVEQNKVIDEAE